MALSRRLFALSAAGWALAAAAEAAPGDGLDGFWQGTLERASGGPLRTPRYNPPNVRIYIHGETARIYSEEDGAFVEAKSGAVTIRRYASNAVVTAIDASPAAPLGQGWVETWSFALTLRDENRVGAVFTRQVNNNHMPPDDESAVFAIVHAGDMTRVYPDHV